MPQIAATKELKTIGATIRRLREKQGLSQEELAFKVGLHRTYIGGVERGERNLGAVNLIRIGRTLGVKPAALLAGIK